MQSNDSAPRCACCQSDQLTPTTKFDPSEGYSRVHFALKQKPASMFSDPYQHFAIKRARVCLACGHVMWGLDTAELTRLRANLRDLDPVHE